MNDIPLRRMWNPKERLAKAIGNNEGPDYENSLHGHGVIQFMGTKFGILMSQGKRRCFFEIEEAVWPINTKLQVGNVVRMDCLYWAKGDVVRWNCPKYEAVFVRLLDSAHKYDISTNVQDVRHIYELPSKLEGTGIVWYKDGVYSLLRETKTNQNVMFYNNVMPDLHHDDMVQFSASRKIRYIEKQGIWTEYEGTHGTYVKQYSRNITYEMGSSSGKCESTSRFVIKDYENISRWREAHDVEDGSTKFCSLSEYALEILRVSRACVAEKDKERKYGVRQGEEESQQSVVIGSRYEERKSIRCIRSQNGNGRAWTRYKKNGAYKRGDSCEREKVATLQKKSYTNCHGYTNLRRDVYQEIKYMQVNYKKYRC